MRTACVSVVLGFIFTYIRSPHICIALYLSAVSILRVTHDSDGQDDDDDDDSSDWGTSSGEEGEGGSAMTPTSLPQFEALVPEEDGLRYVCACCLCDCVGCGVCVMYVWMDGCVCVCCVVCVLLGYVMSVTLYALGGRCLLHSLQWKPNV